MCREGHVIDACRFQVRLPTLAAVDMRYSVKTGHGGEGERADVVGGER